ncbi:zinc phosphodiesterase [Achlya hypogyna]|uniref:ribonuclease Z n=1 Tax=Achlya hypogyna TaxID=1202772 RepID=A0A1V9YTJ7_ACHHY|nr:zinc phosphodiesterase [Achlya hypogyna]
MTAPLSVSLNVLGTGSDGTEGSLVFSITKHGVYSDDATIDRYMFNCGEGTQRLCGENGIKLGSLNSIFLSRLDPMYAAGIPGMILALGTCGAPDLHVVGPGGTHTYLTSTSSFARRQYPAIRCSEIGGLATAKGPSHVAHDARQSNVMLVDDPYVRVLPLVAKLDRIEHIRPTTCRICSHAPTPAPQAVASVPKTVTRDLSATKEDSTFLQWLTAFYTAKDPSKIPYVPVIANKYKGRDDDLKRMLEDKYGPYEPQQSSSGSSSSSSEDNSDDDAQKENSCCAESNADAKVATDDATEGSIEDWLRQFYLKHNPAMMPRMQSVLKTYAGRDEHLKQMLRQKYAKRPAESPAADNRCEKKVKLADASSSHEVFVPPASFEEDIPAQLDQVVFYILEFKGSAPCIVWIVDLPSATWIPYLQHHFSVCPEHRPSLVVHFTKSTDVVHPGYTQWIDTISGPTTEHMLFDGHVLAAYDAGRLGFNFKASAQHRLQLHDQAPVLFPLSSAFASLSMTEPAELKLRVKVLDSPASYVLRLAQPRLALVLRAAKAHHATGFTYEPLEWTLPATPPSPPQPFNGPKITFLGTGSAAPSKLRNSSAIYLEFQPNMGLLIDCGEGTYGQLWRQFGRSTRARIRDLTCIWLSHKHADHHCGLIRILFERSQARAPLPLIVVAPDDILKYVTQWQQPWATANVHFVSCQAFNQPSHPLRHGLFQATGFRNFWSVPVQHCYDAYGLIFFLHDGTKIVYSGDTRPCARLVAEGMDADVLIHEATFEDSMREDAIKKKHSTVGEAITVGRDMRARTVLLTHFSQRYPTLPPRQQAGAAMNRVGFAFDGMQVSLSPAGLAALDAFMLSIASVPV